MKTATFSSIYVYLQKEGTISICVPGVPDSELGYQVSVDSKYIGVLGVPLTFLILCMVYVAVTEK